MKLKMLSEGFDFNKPGEQNRCDTIQAAIFRLREMIEDPNNSRVSVIDELLRSLRGLVRGVAIESTEEREQIGEILSLLAASREQLVNIPDGPPLEEIIEHIVVLLYATHHFCASHKHRGDRAI
jgi:hypothetical protein